MKVEIHLYSQSSPMVLVDVKNTYTKDNLFCVMDKDGVVQKFPYLHIFRVKEFPCTTQSVG